MSERTELRIEAESIISLVYHYSFDEAEKRISEMEKAEDDYPRYAIAVCLRYMMEDYRDINQMPFWDYEARILPVDQLNEDKITASEIWIRVLVSCVKSMTVPQDERKKIIGKVSSLVSSDDMDIGPYILVQSMKAYNNLDSNPGQAVRILKECYEKMLGVYGKDDWRVIAVLAELASAYTDYDKPEKAIEVGENAYKEAVGCLGKDDPMLIMILDNLASAATVLYNDDTKGYPYLRDAYDICLKTLGADNPKSLDIEEGLEIALEYMGKNDEILPIKENTLAVCLEKGNKRSLVSAYSSLAGSYHDSDAKKCEELLLKAYETAKEACKEDSIVFRQVLSLVRFYKEKGNEVKADGILLDFFMVLVDRCGTDSSVAYISFIDLFAQHFQFLQLPLSFFKAALSRTDADSMLYFTLLTEYAVRFKQSGAIDDAMGYYKEALSFAEKHFTSESEAYAACRLNIGIAFEALGNRRRAMRYIRECIEIYHKLDTHSKDSALASYNLGIMYIDEGRFEEAIPLFEEALAFYKKDGNNVQAASSAFHLGISYQESKKLEKAYRCFSEAYAKYIAESEEENALISETLIHMATLNIDMGNYQKALEQAKKAYDIDKEIKGEDSYTAGFDLYVVSTSFWFLKRYEEAAKNAMQAIRILEKYDNDIQTEAAFEVAIEAYEKLGKIKRTEALREEMRRRFR